MAIDRYAGTASRSAGNKREIAHADLLAKTHRYALCLDDIGDSRQVGWRVSDLFGLAVLNRRPSFPHGRHHHVCAWQQSSQSIDACVVAALERVGGDKLPTTIPVFHPHGEDARTFDWVPDLVG